MNNNHKVSALAAVLIAAGVGSATAKGQDGPAFRSLEKLAANGLANHSYDGNYRLSYSADSTVAKAPGLTAKVALQNHVLQRSPAAYAPAHAAPAAKQKSSWFRGGVWIGGGLLGAAAGVLIAGAVSGGLLLPVALGLFGFMVGATIADMIFKVAD